MPYAKTTHALLAFTALIAACGSPASVAVGRSSAAPSAVAQASTAPSPSASIPCERTASGSGTAPQAQIVDVRVATHEGFDRIVFEFAGRLGPAGVPSYEIRDVDRPLYQDASGLPLSVAGDPVLRITLRGGTRASVEGTSTYDGSTDLVPAFPILRELKEGGDFEAIATWYAGLKAGACVRASTLSDPARLVIDLSRP